MDMRFDKIKTIISNPITWGWCGFAAYALILYGYDKYVSYLWKRDEANQALFYSVGPTTQVATFFECELIFILVGLLLIMIGFTIYGYDK